MLKIQPFDKIKTTLLCYQVSYSQSQNNSMKTWFWEIYILHYQKVAIKTSILKNIQRVSQGDTVIV